MITESCKKYEKIIKNKGKKTLDDSEKKLYGNMYFFILIYHFFTFLLYIFYSQFTFGRKFRSITVLC